MKKLHLADGLTLPIDAVTQTFAILAKRGAGKSYTAAVFAEEMLRAGQAVVIIDPTGAHWGLRSSADGKAAGYPIVVLGGDHADLPLEETAGEVVAQSIVENRFPAIIDLSHFRKAQSIRFMTPFLEALYRLNREALHLIVDEADTFAPQRVLGDEARLCGAMEDCAKKGRIRGLGMTLITQRPAVLNKNVLTQCESLIVLRMTHPKDIGAIEEWVGVHATPEEEAEVVADLPTLPIGTAWFWSPGWLQTLKKISVRPRTTFDSGATPKPGESRKAPKQLAAVDLKALGQQMQATAASAKANDPKELKRRIGELEKQLAAKPTTMAVPDKATIATAVRTAVAQRDAEWEARFVELQERLNHADGQLTAIRDLAKSPGKAKPIMAPSAKPLKVTVTASPIATKPAAARTVPAKPVALADGLQPAHQRILNALAWLEVMGIDQPARANVAAIAGASPSSSSFSNNLGRLSSMGLVEYPAPGLIRLTDAGSRSAERPDHPPTQAEIHEAWRRCPALQPAHVRILDAVIETFPEMRTRQQLAEAVGASASSSSFSNNLGRLSSMGLVKYPRPSFVVANAELLFPK